jgi:hypothetical protein
MNGLHENEPTESEPMMAFPNARHALEMSRDENGQVCEKNHHEQDHPRRHGADIG